MPKTASKREVIVEAALKLFYQYGFTATGVDKIIGEAKVSKKTLYTHFRTKEELILATLRARDEQFRNFFMREVNERAGKSKDKLYAMFDVVHDWINGETFSGCLFINAAAEYGDKRNANHKMCAEHKRLVVQYISEVAKKAGAINNEKLAKQINLLIEGAIVNAYVMNDKRAAYIAKSMARPFIEQALSPEERRAAPLKF